MEYKHGIRMRKQTTCTGVNVVTAAVAVFVIWSYISQGISLPVIIRRVETVKAASDLEWPFRRRCRQNPARALIDSIKEVTRQVESHSGTSTWSHGAEITNEERESWNRQNPCLSRSELIPMYHERKYAKKLPANPLWDELFTEYSKLHRTCMRNVGNLTDYFLTGNSSTGCQFVVGSVMENGLGNKFLASLPSVLYAILTKRVILMPSSTLVPYSTCEPFLGSSWLLDSKAFPVPHFSDGSGFHSSPWTFDTDFFGQIDQMMKEKNHIMRERFESPATSLKHVHAVGTSCEQWEPSNRFYCSAEQNFYSQVTWVQLSGCIYSMPKLFASPLFRHTLEALFPDKLVMTRLLRSVFLPSDTVWNRVLSINQDHMAGADRRVGIQVRYSNGITQYTRMNDLINGRIVNCTQQYSILPNISAARHPSASPKRENASPKVRPNSVVKVYIASLFPGLQNHLSEIYVRDPTLMFGEDVDLVQISQNLDQEYHSIEEDHQAFTEVLLLSFSDQLLLTPCSTFGTLAQGYGALTPWLIERREEDPDGLLPSCQRSPTVDSCNMWTDKFYRCSHDTVVNEKPIADVVPYIKDCLPIEDPYGIQIITTFQS